MQTSLIVLLSIVLAWFQANGHITLGNLTFFAILALWGWDLKERLDEIERKEEQAHEQCNN